MADLVLRAARSDDFPALVALALASADAGEIRVAPRYIRNPVAALAALKPELEWVVAERAGRIVGAGQVIFSETELEGERFRCACLSSLMVHPEHRRQGIARAITRRRLERAGPDALIVAAIQTGNAASLAKARKWATQIFGSLIMPIFRATTRAFSTANVVVGEPRDAGQWEAAAAGQAAFERGWNLRTLETGESLRERALRVFDGRRFTRYYVALEEGRVVGGFELFETAQLRTLVFEHVPVPWRALNAFVRVLARDGELRENALSRMWHVRGRADVGQLLWRAARAFAAESGNAVGMQFDARGPYCRLLPLRPWTPKGTVSVAVRSPIPLSEQPLLSPP